MSADSMTASNPITAIVARLEAAAEGSRELDAEIARAVGWILNQTLWCSPTGLWQRHPPQFTTSLDAAMTLVPDDAGLRLDKYWRIAPGIWWQAGIHWDNGEYVEALDLPTAALAVVLASLRCRIARALPDQPSGRTEVVG